MACRATPGGKAVAKALLVSFQVLPQGSGISWRSAGWDPLEGENHMVISSKDKCIPIGSMYGIFTNIYPINDSNVGKYTIHGSYGMYIYITIYKDECI